MLSTVNHVLNTSPYGHSTVSQNAPPMPVRVDVPRPALVDAETLLQLLRQVQMCEQPKGVYADTGGPMVVGPAAAYRQEGAEDSPAESVSSTSQSIEQRAATPSEIDMIDGKDNPDTVTLPQTQHQKQHQTQQIHIQNTIATDVDRTSVETGKTPK